ncbi:MAG: U32 family peptidase, partial [Spirochaetaceae bacterium]|nr:U32 family peptidase [Spirochaetaceae bacterium]
FSSYLGGKSANRGLCTQACRRLYTAEINGVPKEGYYFSPYDLQLIDVIPSLIQAGVDSFKIEGRMKSAEYVGCVVSAYRYLMDNWESDPEGAIATAKRKLSSDFAREKTLYWYQKGAPANILNPDQAGGTGLKLGKIKQTRVFKNAEPVEESLDENEPKGADPKATAPFGAAPSGAAPKTTALYASLTGGYTPEPGDSIRLHRKDDTGRESHKIKDVRFADSDSWIDIPSGFSTGDEVYLIQTKTQGKRYQRILPPDLSRFRSHPGAQKVPSLELPRLDKAALDVFPEGLYIQVSTVADMHAVLSAKPTAVILELNSETITSLIENKEILPLQKKQVYISLDPFFPQGDEDRIAGIVDFLIEEGYWHWVVNNPGHLALLRNRKVRTLAGPYLYTFNRWAISWLSSQGITHFITPLENSRQNLERTVDSDRRKQAFVTLFAYPALFRMRFKLPEKYDFLYFSDKQDTVFKAMSTPDGSFVLPENPYSIIDKIGFLQSSGFSHFILDLSKTIVRKNDFRQIMTALEKETMLPDTERFNWKDGFYSPEDMEQRANTAQWLAEKQRGADKSRFTEKPESYGKQRSTDKHWGAGKPRGVGSTQHSGGKSFGAGKSRGSFQKNTDPCNPGGRRTPRNKPK